MDLPKVAAKTPIRVEVEEGKKYAWCTCGLSDKQPFCNGAHKGTEFRPTVFTAEESKTISFCQCKASKNGYRCDGTHKSL